MNMLIESIVEPPIAYTAYKINFFFELQSIIGCLLNSIYKKINKKIYVIKPHP